MSVSTRSQHRTRMFARVLGPYLTVVPVVAMARANDMPQLLSAFTTSEVLPWVMGAFILLGGIAIVAFHQYWRGPAAIIVSVLGWLLVVRGLFLMVFPDTFASLADRVIDATGVWMAIFVVLALIGLYLTYAGWKPVQEDLHDGDVRVSVTRHAA